MILRRRVNVETFIGIRTKCCGRITDVSKKIAIKEGGFIMAAEEIKIYSTPT